MKHCYLHLGFHKTGTTSFQLTVRKNSNLLEEQGIILPQFHGKNNNISANHSGQIRKLFHAKTRNLSSQESISQYQKEFSKLLKEDRHILISGEGISTLPKKSIESLVDEIAKHGFMVKPFALVRSPYAYLNSALQQTIKNGQHHELIQFGRQCLTASEITSKLPNTLKSIQTLKQIFGATIEFYPFQQALNDPNGPVAFILQDILKLENTSSFAINSANESQSNISTRVTNLLNANVDQPKDDAIPKATTKALEKKYGKEKFLLTEVEYQLIESKFIEIKNGMLKCLGPQFVDESVQFSKHFTAVEIDKILGMVSKAHHSLSTIK